MSKSSLQSPSLFRPATIALAMRMLGAGLITALAVGLVVPVPSAGATPSEPVQKGLDIDGEALGDQSGWSVALSADGHTVAIGAPGNDGTDSNAGHVRVYRWSGSAWVQRGADIDGEAADDESGYAVALSADGHTVAIGAPGNDGNGSNSGHVRVFAVAVDDAGSVLPPDDAGSALPPSVSCVPLVPVVGAVLTCTVTGGDAGIDILWRAATGSAFAGEGVALDAAGEGEFSFVVPVSALGEELTVELVEWTAPMSLGVVGGPVPGSVPAGEGPVPMWPILLIALVTLGLLLRGMRAEG